MYCVVLSAADSDGRGVSGEVFFDCVVSWFRPPAADSDGRGVSGEVFFNCFVSWFRPPAADSDGRGVSGEHTRPSSGGLASSFVGSHS